MLTTDSTAATILIATNDIADAALVKKLLGNEFEKIFTSTAPDRSVEDFVRHPPDVLVLAFNDLEKSQHYYLRLFRLSAAVHLQPHRTVILCNINELRQAYALCRDGLFDDYILFWPMVHDALRLPMSVHLALRELAVLRDGGPTPANFAVQARRLAELETLLNQQMVRGTRHMEAASEIVGKAEQGMGAAMGKSVQPLTQWVDEFQQALVPHLESVRSLKAMAERVRPTVLVVDDDEFQHKIVRKILEGENYHLVFGAGGLETLSILRKMRPDLILMDVMMPGMDGLEVMRQIRSVPRLADIPIIMITGKGEKNIVTESLKAGATDFIVKPFARGTLLGKITKVLRGT